MHLLIPFLALSCTQRAASPTPAPGMLVADVWADNWFAMYQGERLVFEDSVPITTERLFNAESFSFEPSWPLVLAFVIKDFKQDDSGLEYIGKPNQQMGDGGFIAQLHDDQGRLVGVSDGSMRCLVVHHAPVDRSCVTAADPLARCGSRIAEEPVGWKLPSFDDAGWAAATVYRADQVRPKGGYDHVAWDPTAKLVWTSDLQADNTLLCRLTIPEPPAGR